MQVKFRNVSFKNLLSYGNVETSIDLEHYAHTIITAKNGSGKSSILDAICYGLYGKPYRNIKLGQLINSINKKALVVTLEFSIGDDEYKIIRGQKPTIFEIYKNGELIPEDSASKGYQEYLETHVLKINFKTFKQIVVIGSASYKPFMDLTAAERRNITEEVLDIAIFSSMQDIAKQKFSEMKSMVESLTTEISMLTSQLESQAELVQTLTEESNTKKQHIETARKAAQDAIADLEQQLSDIDDRIEQIGDVSSTLETLQANKNKLGVKIGKIDNAIETLTESIEFYNSSECPTCKQHIEPSFRDKNVSDATDKICQHETIKNQMDELLKSFTEKIAAVSEQVKKHIDLVSDRRNVAYSLKTQKAILAGLIDEPVQQDSLELSKTKLTAIQNAIDRKIELKNDAAIEMAHQRAAVELLKDTGIKSKIIATFIPVLNSMINEYLQIFNLFVSFELDEAFNETIKSRDRDTFTYNSFSEGEKQKIDLSMLFAWRKIAMSRNSVSTNLLIFDETLDKSLDSESVDTFVNILGSIEDSVNSIVISHREVVPELFDRHITITKVRDFSVMAQNMAVGH